MGSSGTLRFFGVLIVLVFFFLDVFPCLDILVNMLNDKLCITSFFVGKDGKVHDRSVKRIQ